MTNGDGQFDETGAGESDGAGFRLTQDFGRPAVGPFAGVVVNRPIDQVLTYRVPARLDRIIQVGQRVRVPLGKGNKQATGYCVSVGDLAPEGLDPRKLKDVAEVLDPVPLDRRQDARAHALAGGILCLLVGTGSRIGGAGGGQEPGRHAGGNVSRGAGGNSPGAEGPDAQAPALAQAGRRARGSLSDRRAALDRRRLPASQMRLRAGAGLAAAGIGSFRSPQADTRQGRLGSGDRHSKKTP